MTTIKSLTTIASTVAISSWAAVAWPALAQPGQAPTRVEPTSSVLRVVSNDSRPGQAAYGWQYFSDPLAGHAVMISPAGEYFLSLGDGAKQITGPTAPVTLARLARN